ncbi:zinc finger protein 318 [Limanda limanda]|uniref:zinc finger protein 318 n=1 Tax=Limanda limanda TaxID=27771 RepID=UPI0029C66913|nr:zinc finger protein 318 [Limanda limanda]
MYRGRPPPRGGYPPPAEARGPRPPRPYPAPDYRDERSRPRPPYHHDHHGPPDPYRRSPPRRRYPSPGAGSHRGAEHWAGGRERSLSPRGPIPLDHNLVITVGNELTSGSGSAPSRHHDRDFPARPEYEAGRSRDRSPDRSRAKSRGRSKSRPRSQSRSPDRSRAKSRGRSKSRPRSQIRSPDRSRAKSRGRSKSRPRSQSRSPDRSRAKSRGRSKSRAFSRSRSRSPSKGRSRGRSFSKVASHGRIRSRSVSSSSSSTSSSRSHSGDERYKKGFKELEMARRRKELEEMLSLPTKSILKKRNDSPSIRNVDSPRDLDGANVSCVADQILQAVKGMDPHMVASVLSELGSDPQTVHRAGFDTEIKEILNLLEGAGVKTPMKAVDDIDDEEKFLYGDSEEPKPPPESEPVRHHGLDMYGDVTEEALYGDYPQTKATIVQTFGPPPGASSHLQAPSTTEELDPKNARRSIISQDQNTAVQVSTPAQPSGTESLEEYEKIQDLLKTIGLDLGVTEISKMAARTKERLHGNKPAKTPTRRRRYSSDSSDGSQGRRRRSRSGSSSSSRSGSRSWGGKRGKSWSSDDSDRKSVPNKSVKDETKVEQKVTAPPPHNEPLPQIPDPQTLPPHSGVPIPTYPPPQVHGMMPPNYPPPGYGQYGNYLPYMHQQWPPLYPPPNISLPPQTGSDEFPPAQQYQEPYHKLASEPGAKGSVKTFAQDREKSVSKLSSYDRKVSEEQNNESQKQKVLEEREKLKHEREVRMKKKDYLMKELERLRKQQGELLRKKRREKEGHKDPLLQEISRLQEEVMTQISNLRKEHEAAEKKRNEIDKVALILGLSPADRPRRVSKPTEDQSVPPPEKKRREAESPEGRPASSGSTLKQNSAAPPSMSQRASPNETPASAPPAAPPPEPFEYYDAGNHWCKNCNATSGSMFDFFTHLQSKTHRKTLDPYDRPWASTSTKITKNTPPEEKLTKPAKGSEFLQPVRGFFCLLCEEFYGDAICAEEHVTTHAHNEKYKKQMYENPLYEQRRNLDRQAGLAVDTSGKKRKHEDDEKSDKYKEEKAKHKKEKKDKDKKKEDDNAVLKEEKSIFKKEVEEERLKDNKPGEDFKSTKNLEEEQSSYIKKDEDESYICNKREDKYRCSEEERGDRHRNSRAEEHRHRHRHDNDERHDDRPKYGPRDDDEEKFKYSKHPPDSRSKYDKERDEGNPKTRREAFKKPELGKPAGKPAWKPEGKPDWKPEGKPDWKPEGKPAWKPDGKPEGKPEVTKPEPPPKPYDPPKIFCGPSPAMRAKLRKQSLEAGKPPPAVTAPTFGKFTWKKKENTLTKVAEKIAAEFIKDDEAAASLQLVSVEDSFAKSVAVAKEIAEKLGGNPPMPPPWVSDGADRGRIRPNLPAPAAVLRKTTMMGKPAPLNTFLSIRPQNTTLQGPPLKDLPLFSQSLSKALSAQNALLEGKSPPAPVEAGLPSPVSRQFPIEVKPAPPVSEPLLTEAKPTPSETKATTSQTKATPTQAKTTPTQGKATPTPVNTTPTQYKATPTPVKTTPTPTKATLPQVKAAPTQARSTEPEGRPQSSVAPPASSEAKPPQSMVVKIVSDVAAPGVPESEQTRTVFVKPPPFMNMTDRFPKSEKLKGNLAAAKARELFGIFYSGISQSGPSSITKSDSRADKSCTLPLPAPQGLNLQPPAQTQVQPTPDVQTSPQPDSTSYSPSSQSQIKSEIQIASVWSLKSDPAPAPEQALSETASATTQPKQTPSAQIETQSVTQIQFQIPLQTETAESDSTPQTLLESDQDSQSHTETNPDATPEPEPKPSPKTRGKKTPPASGPVRQTRSQTRYQTRRQQQQQGQFELQSEIASGNSESALSDPKSLDTSDPDTGSRSEEGNPSEVDPHVMEITTETLGLPSDMTSLDFEYDFNFE